MYNLLKNRTYDYEDQRIGVFVDVQNLYYSAYNIYHARVNFGAILDTAIQKRKLIRAIAYAIKADQPEEESFFEALYKQGYEVKHKPLQVFIGGAKKGDWDVGMSLDILSLADKLDVIILVSGDGDFKDVIQFIKANGARAEVMAFGKSASSSLKEVADLFIDLDEDYKKFTLPMPNKKNNGKNDDSGREQREVKIYSS